MNHVLTILAVAKAKYWKKPSNFAVFDLFGTSPFVGCLYSKNGKSQKHAHAFKI